MAPSKAAGMDRRTGSCRVMVEQIMESLSEKERYFLREYFWKERTVRSIAQSMKVTERTVYRLRDSVLKKIREKFL